MSVDKKKISYLIDLGMKTAFNRGALKFAVELSRLNLEDKAVDVLKKMPFIDTPKNKKYMEIAAKFFKKEFSTCDEVDAYSIAVALNTIYSKYAMTTAQVEMKNKLIEAIIRINENKIKKGGKDVRG